MLVKQLEMKYVWIKILLGYGYGLFTVINHIND